MIEGKLISYFCAVGMILMTVACSSEDEPGCVLGGPTVFEAGAKILTASPMEDTVICNIDSIGYERAWDEYGVTIDGEGTFLIADSKYVGLSFTDYKALYGNALLDGDERTLLRVRLDPVEHNITCMLPRNQGKNRFYKVTVGINSKDNLRGLRITIFLYQPGIK